jgi:hypothetical protein
MKTDERLPAPRPRTLPRLKINVEEPAQLLWWCDHLGVTFAQLVGAIRKVGVDADAVRKALGRR